MATNRIIPPPEEPGPRPAEQAHAERELEQRHEERLKNTLRAGATAQLILGVLAVLAA